MAGVRPVSIKDQLIRSTLVVDALVNEGLVGPKSPLLVYGGGAAGMNSALRAARKHGTPVYVLEQERLFTTLDASMRRARITEYDWPRKSHRATSREDVLPLMPQPGLMRGPRMVSGAVLAAHWLEVWDDFQAVNGTLPNGLVTVLKRNAKDFRIVGSGKYPLRVSGPWDAAAAPYTPKHFGAALCCVGPGPEKIGEYPDLGAWHGYVGPDFWGDNDGLDYRDRLPDPLAAAIASGLSDGAVISGGGDGAMQDFQRVATGAFGSALYNRLMRLETQFSPGYIRPSKELLSRFMHADEVGRRASCWGLGGRRWPDSLLQWHDQFQRPVEAIVKKWSDEGNATKIAGCLFRPQVMKGKLRITWVIRDTTPGAGYALNRYLILLLLALGRRVLPAGTIRYLPSSSINAIEPVGHDCHASRDDPCFYRRHRVHIDTARERLVLAADLIIVRHGLHEIDQSVGGRPPVLEQMVPFQLPS
jgi:hypothetical protein